jgi:hypothetical protein
MKPRRVVVTIEMTTSDTVDALKRDYMYTSGPCETIHKVSVKLVKTVKGAKKCADAQTKK